MPAGLQASASLRGSASQRQLGKLEPLWRGGMSAAVRLESRRWPQRRLAGGAAAAARVVQAVSSPSPPQQPAGAPPGQLDFPPVTLLGGRYKVAELLGHGMNGVTYRCRDNDSGSDVAVKCLSLRSLRDWKQLDLFEREAAVLRSLEHPGIPRYLACFEQDTERDRAFFLVQEAVQGASLAVMLRSGWRADEAEVARIAAELLGTLRYLGSRRPPVVHRKGRDACTSPAVRDVKPENIVVEGGRSGGKVFLVDFGGVQAATAAAADGLAGGGTVVGTFGFMAPEQFCGAASPACDLYGLGATLLLLLSGRPPSAFLAARLRLDLRSVNMGGRLRAVVKGLLEPAPEERMQAEEALAILEGQRLPAGEPGGADAAAEAAIVKRRPDPSKVTVRKARPPPGDCHPSPALEVPRLYKRWYTHRPRFRCLLRELVTGGWPDGPALCLAHVDVAAGARLPEALCAGAGHH
ncbi:hypothetical protein ABPG75_004786 [Micractinium tetrahymenae]